MEEKQASGQPMYQEPAPAGSLKSFDDSSLVSSFASLPENGYQVDNTLEVHAPNAGQKTATLANASKTTPAFSKRKSLIVSVAITIVVTLFTGVSALLLGRNAPNTPNNSASLTVPIQDIGLTDDRSLRLPSELQGNSESLLIAGDVITRGSLKFSNNSYVTVLKSTEITANRTLTLPDASGTLCLDTNNCNFAELGQLGELDGRIAQLGQQLNNFIVSDDSGVTSVNNQTGLITVQGSLNRISVNTTGGVVTLTTPQDLDANANVQFGNLTLSASGSIRANNIQQTAAGNNIAIGAGADAIVFTAGGRTFTFPASGPAAQTICTDSVTCASGGGTALILSPSGVQTDGDADNSIFINDTGGGNLVQIQSQGIDRLVVDNVGNTTIAGSLTVSGLGNGFVRSTAGALSVVSAIDLASTDVTNTLPVNRGGTGASSLSANGVLVGNGTSPVSAVTAGGTGLCLVSNAGSPTFQVCPGTGDVTDVNGLSGSVTLQGTANQVSVSTGAGVITLSTPQNINTAASPTFASLTLSGLGNGVVRVSAGTLTTGVVSLTSEVSGTLPIGNGGTGLAATPTNGQLLIGNGTNYTLASLTQGAGIAIANGAGSITIASAFGAEIDLGTETAGNYVSGFSGGAGVNVTGSGGEGSTPTIALILQAGKGLEVDANGLSLIDCAVDQVLKYNVSNQWVCGTDVDTTGSFNVAGDTGIPENVANGDTLTIQGGNNIATTVGATDTITIATVNNPTFTTSVTTPLLQSSGALSITPNGALNVGATGQTALLQGSTTTITSNGIGNDIVLTTADQIRLTGFNCSTFANGGTLTTDISGNIGCANDDGPAPNTVTGTGTTNRIALFTGANAVADSWLLQNGSTLELDNTRNLSVTGGNFSVTGTGLFTGLITANGGITVETGDMFTFNGEAFTDLTGTGLAFSSGSLQTTLGTSVDLTSEVVGVLPVANGGTGINGSLAANGTLLIGNGTGYTLATLMAGSGITVNNSAGGIEIVNFFGTSIESGEITDLTITGADIANDTIALGTKTTGNYVAGVTGSSEISVGGSGSETAAVTLGLIADSIGDTHLAFNTGQHLTTISSPTFSGLTLNGNLTVGGGSASLGAALQAGTLTLSDGSNNTGTLQTTALGQNTAFTLPDPGAATATICLSTGNCSGAGGGVTTAGGTNNRLAKFNGAQTIADSTITDDGTNVTTSVDFIVQGGSATIGTALQDGALTLYGNGFTAAISAALTANQTFGLPDGSGEFCIKEVANCSGAGGGNAPNSAQYLTLALDAGLTAERTLSFNGTNFSVVDNGANGSYTVNTAQNINTAATPSFAGLTLTSNLNMNANTIQGTTAVIDFTNFDVSSTGLVTAGTYNGQTISAAASFTGTLAVAGLTTLNGGLTIEAGDTLTVNGDGFTDLTGNGLQVTTGALTLAIQANKGLEVDMNGLSLMDCANGEILKYNTTGGTWGCSADAGGTGVGDDVSVNGTNADGANFLNTAASGTVASTTWSLNAVSNPDDITLVIGTASATEAGIITTGVQTFAGAKTFNGSIIAGGGVNLGTQTLQGTTAVIDFNNFDVTAAGAVTAVGVNAGSGLLQGTGGLTIAGTITLSSLTNGFLEVSGTGVISVGTIDLGTDTEGNYVATITSGNGISGAATGEGSTPTIALSNLTSDWLQSGAFDIVLDNSASELKILESGLTPTFYAIFDVADLAADQTFLLNEGGTVVTSGNVASYATTAVTAGSGLTGGGTVGALTLNIASGNGGITVNANDIALTLQANKGLEVDINGLSLIDCASGEILKYNGTNQWACAADAGGAGLGDDVTVNGSAADGANFLNTVASGTSTAITWSLNTVSNPDDITVAIGNASATAAGAVTTGAQTFAGDKTFNGQVITAGGIALGTQTLQGTTAAIDFTNFDVSTGGAIIAAGTAVIQGSSVTVGAAAQQGSFILNDGSTNTGTIQTAALGSNRVYILPDEGTNAVICLNTGNCAGSGTGVTTAGGTTNRLAKFSGSQAIADSSISDDGTNVTVLGTTDLIVQGGDLTIGTITGQGSLLLHDGNGQTATLRAGDSVGNLTFVLPTDLGTGSQCLKNSATPGTLTFANCNNGSGSGGAITLQDAYDASATPAAILLATGKNLVVTSPDVVTDPSVLFNLQCATCSANGGRFAVQDNGTDVFTVNPDGSIVLVGTQIQVTSAGNLTVSGTGSFQGASVSVGATALQGTLILNDGSTNTGTIQTANLASNRTYILPDLGTNAVICLDTGNCAGSGSGLTGSGAAGQVAYFDATQNLISSANLLFDGTNMDVAGTLTVGTANAFQVSAAGAVTAVGVNSGTGLLQGTGGLTLTGTANINTTGTASTSIGNSSGAVTLTGTGINLNASLLERVAAGTTTFNLNDTANTTLAVSNSGAGVANITVDGNGTFAGTLAVQGASVTIGAAALQGSLVLHDGNGGQTATIQVDNIAANTVLTLPGTLGASDTFCFLTLNNCAGSATTLQGAYDADVNGFDAIISLTTADDSLIIRNPAASGSDSAFVLKVEQLATGAVDGLVVNHAGTGYALRINDDGTDTDSSPFIIDQNGNVAIGATSATAKLEVITSGATAEAALFSSSNITGSGNTVNIQGSLGRQSTSSTYQAGLNIASGITPTSGSSNISFIDVNGSVNQTGGANGITNGVLIRPTLTAATDFRAINLQNNAGFGIYQAGSSANNYFAGNVGIGTATPTQAQLVINQANQNTTQGLSIIEGGVERFKLYTTTSNNSFIDLNHNVTTIRNTNANGQLNLLTARHMTFSSTSATDTGFSFNAQSVTVANIGQTAMTFGNGVTNAAPASYLLQATGGSGTDIAGASLTFAGGRGTGTGVGGSLLFQTAAAGATGATLNPLTTRMEIQADGNIAMDTNTLYVDATNNSVGIGSTSTSNSKLRIYGTTTNTASSQAGIDLDYVATLSANSSAQYNGIKSFTDVAPATGTTASGQVAGLEAQAQHSGAGVISDLYGGVFQAGLNSTGNATNTYGARVLSPYSTSTGTITTAYGLRIDTQDIGAAVGTGYGLYQQGASDLNYFAGNVGIGATPSFKLQVNATTGTVSNTPQAIINTGALGNVGLAIQTQSGQTADSLQIINNAGSVLAKFDSNGDLVLGSTARKGSMVLHDGATRTITLTVGTIGTSYSLILPDSVGASGECLKNSGTPGALAFASCGSTGITTSLQDAYNNSGIPATITSTSSAKTILFQSGVASNTTSFFDIKANGVANPVLSVDTANQRVGIGTSTPQTALHVNGVIRADTLGSAGSTSICRNASNEISSCSGGNITGSGTSGQVAFFTGANTLGSNSGFTWNNTTGGLALNIAQSSTGDGPVMFSVSGGKGNNNNTLGGTAWNGGTTVIQSGSGGDVSQATSTSGSGGNLTLQAGNSGSAISASQRGNGGSVDILAGAAISGGGNGGTGGSVNLTAGTGGFSDETGQSAGAGGSIAITAGGAGNATTGATGANGGTITITGGAGGGGSGTSNGGNLVLQGGAAGSGGSTGSVTLQGSGGNVIIGAVDATASLLVVDTKNTAGDPTGQNGAIYYNSNSSKFRCYQASAWVDCIAATGTATTLQASYNADVDGSDAVIALTAADDSIIFRNPAAGGSDSTFVLKVEQLNAGAVDGLIINHAGTGYALRINDDGTDTDTTPFVIDQNGNVGIGIAAPTSLVHMNGTGVGGLFKVTDTTATARDVFTIADGGLATFRTQTDSSLALQAMNAAGVAIFKVDTTGNGAVNIETAGANGTAALNVNGVIYGQVTSGTGDVLRVGNDSKLVDLNLANTLGVYGLTDTTVGSIQFGSGGGTISGAAGNIGIGTAAPDEKLQVVGGNILLDNARNIQFKDSAGTKRNVLGVDVNDDINLGNASLDDIRFNVTTVGTAMLIQKTTGNVGIGDATPAYQFTVGSGDVSGIDSSGNILIKAAGAAATADLSFGSGANRTINVLTQTAANTAGNNLTMQAATGNGTGTGGTLQLTGGVGGATAAAGGNVLIQGGAAGAGGTASGSVIVRSNTNNSTTAFLIQNADTTALFTADTTNKLVKIGTGTPAITSGATGALYVTNSLEVAGRLLIGSTSNGADTNSGKLRYTGTYRNERAITLRPEFDGLTLNGTGVGTLNSGFCSNVAGGLSVNTGLCAANDSHSYYEWTTSEVAAQSYDLYVRYKLPSDFSGFLDLNTIKLFGRRTASTASVALAAYQANGTLCGASQTITSADNTWQEVSHNGDETGCTFAAGDIITFKITLTAQNGSTARVGELNFSYLSAF